VNNSTTQENPNTVEGTTEGVPEGTTEGDNNVSLFSNNGSLKEVTEIEEIELESGTKVEVAKGQILVYTNEDVTPEELSNIEKTILDLGGEIIGSLLETRTIQVKLPEDEKKSDFISQIRSISGVAYADFNFVIDFSIKDNEDGYKMFLQNRYFENNERIKEIIEGEETIEGYYEGVYEGYDEGYDEGEGDLYLYWIDHVDADKAWKLINASDITEVNVGIVDTGIAKEQQVLDEHRIKRYQYNPTNNNVEFIEDDDTKDIEDHGLAVTAFISGYMDIPNKIRGINWFNNVIVFDVFRKKTDLFNRLFLTDVDTSIKLLIEDGVKIINISIGVKIEGPQSDQQKAEIKQRYRRSLSSLVALAKRSDCLLVFSAGNNGFKKDDDLFGPFLRSDSMEKDSWDTHAIIVGASNKLFKDADFSDLGKIVNILAPGDDIGFGNGKPYRGTSFSAPLVTGTLALLKGLNETLSSPEMRYIVIDTADPVLRASDYLLSAYEIYTPTPNLLLNVNDAVKVAKATQGIPLDVFDPMIISKDEVKSIDINVTSPSTSVYGMDILFLIDTTGSYSDDIDTLQQKATEIINNLSALGVDVQMGVASFADYPFTPFGDEYSGDEAFYLNQSITNNIDDVLSAIDSLDQPLHYGYDDPESQLEALYQSATGEGRDLNMDGDFNDTGDILPQNIGWRTTSLKIIIFSTDAIFHKPEDEPTYYGPTFDETIQALKRKGIIVIGLDTGDTGEDLKTVVDATKGVLFSLSSDSREIVDAIVNGLDVVLGKLDISIEAISGKGWIYEVIPERYTDVEPGDTKNFNVKIKGIKNSTVETLKYDIYLWIRSNNGLIKRIKLPIEVPTQRH